MERTMTLETLGLGGGSVRVQISSADAFMNVDLTREDAVNHAASVLRHAGVSSIQVDPDGSYKAKG